MRPKFSKKTGMAIVGAGKLAHSLAHALTRNGYNLRAVFSRTEQSAENLSAKYSIKNYSASFEKIGKEIRIFFLAVPDSEIRPVSKKISAQKLDFDKLLFIHLSGANNSSLLDPLRKQGAASASFHIMQTFPSRSPVKIAGFPASVETNDERGRIFLHNLSRDLKLKSFDLNRREKLQYHLAGVFASNFLVANLFASQYLIERIKNLDKKSLLMFEPIIKSTLSNIFSDSAEKALSGPVERGDVKTVIDHLRFLKRKEYLFLKQTYIEQSLLTLKAAEKKSGALNSGQKSIAKLLRES